MSIQETKEHEVTFSNDGASVYLDESKIKTYGTIEFLGKEYLVITEPSPDGSKYDEFPPVYAKAILMNQVNNIRRNRFDGKSWYEVYDITWRTDRLFYNMGVFDDGSVQMKPPEEWGPPDIVWKVC